MKAKVALLSILAVASIIVTLLALSADGISHASPDEESGQVNVTSLYSV